MRYRLVVSNTSTSLLSTVSSSSGVSSCNRLRQSDRSGEGASYLIRHHSSSNGPIIAPPPPPSRTHFEVNGNLIGYNSPGPNVSSTGGGAGGGAAVMEPSIVHGGGGGGSHHPPAPAQIRSYAPLGGGAANGFVESLSPMENREVRARKKRKKRND